jgi:hypothetical protein
MGTDAHEASVRIGQNQALFREVNERVKLLRNGTYPLTEVDFICECADDSCFEPVALTVSQYEAVRLRPDRFLVCPEHVHPEAETVSERYDDYWIVEKNGAARRIVVAADARRAASGA